MNLSSKRAEIRSYVDRLMIESPTMVYNGTPFAILGESDGDACLFNGLLSTVGVPLGARAVFDSQARPGDPKAGMFYRSPRRRATDNQGYQAFFSRDMALGVLCVYANAPRFDSLAQNSAERWLEWICNNRACAIKKPWPFKGCLIRGPYRYAPDDRSDITPNMWSIMSRVWSYHGWPFPKMMSCLTPNAYDPIIDPLSMIEAGSCELGYQLHLKAVQAYIKLLLRHDRKFSQGVGRIAYDRIPGNLFYEFLAKRTVTEDMIDRYLDMKPDPDKVGGNSWLWEKSDVTEDRIGRSCGWDFVFMGKLLLRHTEY